MVRMQEHTETQINVHQWLASPFSHSVHLKYENQYSYQETKINKNPKAQSISNLKSKQCYVR